MAKNCGIKTELEKTISVFASFLGILAPRNIKYPNRPGFFLLGDERKLPSVAEKCACSPNQKKFPNRIPSPARFSIYTPLNFILSPYK